MTQETHEETALVVISTELDVATRFFSHPNSVAPLIEKIRGHVVGRPEFDVTTEEGRAELRAFRWRITKSRTLVEGVGKTVAADIKKIPVIVDANRKAFRSACEELEAEVSAPLEAWEAKEAERKAVHMTTIGRLIGAMEVTAELPADALVTIRKELLDMHPGSHEEFEEEVALMKRTALDNVEARIVERKHRDAEAEELATLRKEKADREAAAAAETKRLANEAFEKELREKGQALALQQEADAKRVAEILAEEMAAADKRAEEKRAANKRHSAKINNEVMEALSKTIAHEWGAHVDTQAIAKVVTMALAKNEIPHTRISY